MASEFIGYGYPKEDGVYCGKKKRGNCNPSVIKVENGQCTLLSGIKNSKSSPYDRSHWFFVCSIEEWSST